MPPPQTRVIEAPLKNDDESCRSCLYTGVGTCIGLSVYFAHLALGDRGEEAAQKNEPANKLDRLNGIKQSGQRSTNSTTAKMRKKNQLPAGKSSDCIQTALRKSFPVQRFRNRPFLWMCSACWGAAGAYRLYLN